MAVTFIAACASAPVADGTGLHEGRYPRRGAGCELAIYYTAVPGVQAWDDLGIAEVTCHIDDSPAECLRRLRNESCRMGGNIIYDVPRQPLRPRDQVMLYRAQVAHTRPGAPSKTEDPDLPPPASAEELSGPVVPFAPANAERPADAPGSDAGAGQPR